MHAASRQAPSIRMIDINIAPDLNEEAVVEDSDLLRLAMMLTQQPI